MPSLLPREYFVYQSSIKAVQLLFLFKVGLELAPLMKAQPTGNPKKDANTGYMLDARLTSTDITKHAAQQTVQPWHSKVSFSFLNINIKVLTSFQDISLYPQSIHRNPAGQQVSVLESVDRTGGGEENQGKGREGRGRCCTSGAFPGVG